jgi:hypothetical protein
MSEAGTCTRALIAQGYSYTVMKSDGVHPYIIRWEIAQWKRGNIEFVPGKWWMGATHGITVDHIFARCELGQVWGEL